MKPKMFNITKLAIPNPCQKVNTNTVSLKEALVSIKAESILQ